MVQEMRVGRMNARISRFILSSRRFPDFVQYSNGDAWNLNQEAS
jgi:hypothetical protein